MARDLINDVRIAVSDSALRTRNGTTTAMVEKLARENPGHRIVVGGHSLGGNVAARVTTEVGSRNNNVDIKAHVFNAGASLPFNVLSKKIDPFTIADTIKTIQSNYNPNVTRHQVKTDPVGMLNIIKNNTTWYGANQSSSHSLKNFEHLRNSFGNNNNNSSSNMKDSNNLLSKFSNSNNGFGGGPFNGSSGGSANQKNFAYLISLMGKNSSIDDFAMHLFSLGLGESYNSCNKNFGFPGTSKG